MATPDEQNLKSLIRSIDELVRSIKQRNGFGNDSNVREGRKGKFRDASKAHEAVEVVAEDLRDLHQSFKGGGKTIADHFEDMVRNLNPVNSALRKLEEGISRNVNNQSKAYTSAARHTVDFIKTVRGNVDDLRNASKAYANLTDQIGDFVTRYDEHAKDQKAYNKKVKQLQKEYTEFFTKSVFKDLRQNFTQFETWLSAAVKNTSSTTKLTEESLKAAGDIQESYKAVNETTKEFLKAVGQSVKKSNEEFQKAITSSLKTLSAAIIKDASKIPDYISSRLKAGFESNQFMDAFRMGMDPSELNAIRAANREAINAVTGYGKYMEKDATESLRIWSDSAKRVGLIGKDAAEFTSNLIQMSYQTGQMYSSKLNDELITQAQTLQQVFGGSITEVTDAMRDFNTQISTIARFNIARTKEEQDVLRKEIAARMLLTKYMGYDIEYMKQQDMMRHNAQFGDIADRIRGAVMGDVAAKTLGRQFGWSAADQELFSKSRRPGARLTNEESSRLISLNEQIGNYKKSYEAQASAAGPLGGFISALVPNVAIERMLAGSGGDQLQAITESTIRAQSIRSARGDISLEEFIKFAEKGQEAQANSINIFEDAVQKFAESAKGWGGVPGSAFAGALAGSVAGIAGKGLLRGIGKSALGGMLGRGGAGILGRIGLGGFGAGAGAAGTTAAGSLGAGSIATGAAGVLSSAAVGAAIGTGLSKWGESAYYGEDGLGKTFTKIFNPLGYGAAALSDYFSSRNHDSVMEVIDRVSKTGEFNSNDIETLIKQKSIGNLWVTDAERDAYRQEAISQLEWLKAAAERRRANSAALDPSRTNIGISNNLDNANGIQRDANGNPIPPSNNDLDKQSLEVLTQMLSVLKETKQDTDEREEMKMVMEQQTSKLRLHQELLANAYAGMF